MLVEVSEIIFYLNSDNRILNILSNIKAHLELSQIFEYSIFLTGD